MTGEVQMKMYSSNNSKNSDKKIIQRLCCICRLIVVFTFFLYLH